MFTYELARSRRGVQKRCVRFRFYAISTWRWWGAPESNVQNYDVISSDKAIDESNVGNRMLRSMGWTEGLVLFFPLSILLLSSVL